LVVVGPVLRPAVAVMADSFAEHGPLTQEYVSGDEALLLTPQHSGRGRKVVGSTLGATLLLGCVVALVRYSGQSPMEKGSDKATIGLATGANTVESGQFSWQIVHRERDLCSSGPENCMATKCCKSSGFHCYAKDDKVAQCAKTCSPSANNLCSPLSETLQLEPDYMHPARSLYCFSVYAQDTGSPKPSYEKELLSEQFERKVSIFACEAYEVYSDVEVSLGEGFLTKVVTDVKGDWHFAKRKETGAWVNTGIFLQVWKAVKEANAYSNYDWVVKVDPDAVFVPERLRDRIQWMPRTTNGVMLQNCQYVDYGFFGNLEVLSTKAFDILVDNAETCYTEIDWKVGIKQGKYGPMGEDLFMEICMEKNGVHKVEAFDVSTDGACEAKRPTDQAKNKKWHSDCKVKSPAMHPFKKPTEWFECFDQTMAL